MKKEHLFLKSKQDGLDLYVTIFMPEDKPKGIVQFAHGMIEHQVYYYDFMEFLTKKGYITIINDHRGHGKSVKSEKDLGYFYDDSAEFVVEDLHQVTMYAKERFKDLPVYLFGHSMGSLISLAYIKKYDKDIDKLIICGLPSMRTAYQLEARLTKLYSLLRGDRHRSKTLNDMVLPKTKEEWFTINKEYLKEMHNDKYTNYYFTVNGFLNLANLMKNVYSKDGWKLNHKKLDMLFLAGGDDRIIISESRWLKSIDFFKKLGYKNIDYKIYPTYKHVIFKDNPEKIYKDMLNFIENTTIVVL